MFLPLQMGPGGMMPSWGWDWGSMWVLMLLPFLAVGAGIVIIVFFLIRGQRQGPEFRSEGPQTQQLLNSMSSSPPLKASQEKNEILGKVVLSLGPTLMDDERRVMDEMARAGGEVLQSDLPKLTGFSKATVSKAIHGLEVRGIVVRERHKWTYWCKVNPRLVDRTLQSENTPGKLSQHTSL